MSNSDGSGIFKSPNGTVTFVGRAAVDIYRLITLRSALRLWLKTGMMPTRGLTLTKMLALATEYTGQRYKKSKQEAERALTDLAAIHPEPKEN